MKQQAHIESFLKRVRSLRSRTLALHGTNLLLTYIAGSYLLACLLAWSYPPAVEWVWPATGTFLGGLVYIVFKYFIRSLFTPFSQDDAALLTESSYPDLNNALINSSQLGRRLEGSQLSNPVTLEFIRELHRRTAPVVKNIDPSSVIDRQSMTTGRNCLLATLSSLILIALFSPEFLIQGYEHWTTPKSPTQVSQLQSTDPHLLVPEAADVNYSIESLELAFHFPSYTGMKKESIKPSDGKIHVLPGTEVKISATTNAPVTGADLVFNEKDNFAMSTESAVVLKGSLLIKEKGFYQFRVKAPQGNKHLLAKKYPVTLGKDRPPNIVLFLANPKPVYFDTDKVNLFYEGKDDFGIKSVELIFFINGKIKRLPVKKFKHNEKDAKGSYTWTLAQMDVSPGDEVQYYLEIKDNDNVFGPNTGQSEAYTFTIFDSTKEMGNLIAMQEELTEKMIALLATGLVRGASLKNQPGNLMGWKQLFTTSADELIEIVTLAQRIHDRGKTIDQFPQSYLNLLKNITTGLSHIRRNQIDALNDLQETLHKPTRANFEEHSPYTSINDRMVGHLENDILFLVKMTNKQKLDRMMGLEEELNELTQTLREEFEKLKDQKSPSAPNELKSKIDKIRETLQKIMDQLSKQTQSMPDEFLNPNAFKRLNMDKFSASLEKMQDLVNRGKLEEALEELKKMAEDLQLLANKLNRADSESDNFIDPEIMEVLDESIRKLDQLKDRQQKLVEETTKMNRKLRQQQSKQFEDELNKLFEELLRNVNAIRELFKNDDKFLEEHEVMKQLHKLMDEEARLKRKVSELSQATIDSNQSEEEELDQHFAKLNKARREQSKIKQEKDSLRVNEFQRFKEALPQLLEKYDSLNELAKLQDLSEFANLFKKTYPDVLRWQNNMRMTPNLRENLSGKVDEDLKQATLLNNEIAKKLGSMIRSIRKNYDSSITEKQKQELDQLAKQESQMREETEQMSQLFEQLNKENPMIPPELQRGIGQTGRHMKRAEKNLRQQNIQEGIEAENLALKGLNDTRDMLNQMKNSNEKTGKTQQQSPSKLGTGSNPDSRRGGSVRMQKERVLLPSEDQYQAPQEFREEILNAMKKQTPKDYQRMVMEYYRDLVK